MYICLCRAVTDATLVAAIRAGARTVDEIGMSTGAGTVCGGCRGTLRELLVQAHEAESRRAVASLPDRTRERSV